LSGAAPEPFGVYVHWPFCKAKCPYCDFNSHVRHRPVDQAAFAAALGREIARFAELAPGRTVTSIFFGGGTPSLMEPSTVGTVLDAIAGHWTVAGDVETSLEANPTSVEAANFAAYRAAGINRVSLGVQALNDGALRLLGRQHSAAEAVAAFAVARAHFDRVSFDLIYARPGQTVEAWSDELSGAVALAIDHLSLYQLTIESGTRFADLHRTGALVVPGDDHARDLWDVTQEVCAAAGLPAYEVSNHARPGAECRHNLLYWRYGEYAGVGPGAHARIADGDDRLALATERNPEAWLDLVDRYGHGVVSTERLTLADQADEMLLMGLRLVEGIDPDRYRRLAGRPLDREALAALEEGGLVETAGEGLRVSPTGRPLLNAVISALAG
jgi:putative oxygen-independent coproporphyrinogen III oxidase